VRSAPVLGRDRFRNATGVATYLQAAEAMQARARQTASCDRRTCSQIPSQAILI